MALRNSSYAGRASLWTYLYRAAVNGSVNLLRSRRRREAVERDLLEQQLLHATTSTARGPEALVLEGEILAAVALLHVKPQRRRVPVLRIMHGLSNTEIAEREQIPLATVGTWLRRGRALSNGFPSRSALSPAAGRIQPKRRSSRSISPASPGGGARMTCSSPQFQGHFAMNRIRAARQALGWTQTELALKAAVSARTIHAVEKGRPCRQATKRQILNALNVPWEQRSEYFAIRTLRRVRPIDQARTA